MVIGWAGLNFFAGTQFFCDSGVSLGKLNNASQSWFQIEEDRDAATPELVRVMIEVVYEGDGRSLLIA